MRRRLFLLLFWCWALPSWAQVPLAVKVERVDDVFQIESTLEVRTDPMTVWRVLTDYERMPEFVPDLRRTKIHERKGNTVMLEQFGTASWLFFSRDIHLFVAITETPAASVDIELVSGDMRVYQCRWEFALGAGGGTRIRYLGRLSPKFAIPKLLGTTIVRSDIERMMQAVHKRLDAEVQAR